MVELLVVIGIITILVGLALAAYGRVRDRGREIQVSAFGAELRTALQTFATNHNGLYPGVAFDINAVDDCNQDGFNEASYPCPANDLPAMGVVGTRMDKMVDPSTGPVLAPTTNPDYRFWDRLYLDNALDRYGRNPFRGDDEPAANIFEVAVVTYANNSTPVTFAGPGGGAFYACLSRPDREGTWYTSAQFNRSTYLNTTTGRIPIGGPGTNCLNDNSLYNGILSPATGPVVGWEPANATRELYPSGDFAYIPLDPARTGDRDLDGNLDDPMFMVYVENYWLILYGSLSRYGKNAPVNMDALAQNGGPKFYRPLGRVDPNDLATSNNPPTPYEILVFRALRGALEVHGTNYTEQLGLTS